MDLLVQCLDWMNMRIQILADTFSLLMVYWGARSSSCCCRSWATTMSSDHSRIERAVNAGIHCEPSAGNNWPPPRTPPPTHASSLLYPTVDSAPCLDSSFLLPSPEVCISHPVYYPSILLFLRLIVANTLHPNQPISKISIKARAREIVTHKVRRALRSVFMHMVETNRGNQHSKNIANDLCSAYGNHSISRKPLRKVHTICWVCSEDISDRSMRLTNPTSII